MSRKRDKWVPSRCRGTRHSRTTVLIVGEGRETERNYFDGLKREQQVGEHYTVTVKRGEGGSRLEIVQRTVDKKNQSRGEFDEVWCVFDCERLDNKQALADFRKALELARKNGIKVAISNPSIEVWFLAHFKRTARSFKNSGEAEAALDKEWQEAFHCAYDKADTTVYRKLAERTATALQNAEDVRTKDHGDKKNLIDCNSSTDVYILVRRLLRSPEEERRQQEMTSLLETIQ